MVLGVNSALSEIQMSVPAYSFLPELPWSAKTLTCCPSLREVSWSVTTGVQYVAGLYTSVKANGRGTENTEDFVLWNLRASLRVSRCLTLFARGENLLAQRYEINAGYPMPRATFIGGIRLDF